MAKLKLSGLVEKMSGKLGGSVLSNTANGTTIRQNSFSQQPVTSLQRSKRNLIYLSGQQWRNMSDAQRLLWAAQTGDYPYTNNAGIVSEYTAYQLAGRANQNLLLVNQPMLFSPGSVIVTDTPSISILAVNGSSFLVDYSGMNTSTYICYYASAPSVSNIARPWSKLRFIGFEETDGASGQSNIKTMYENKFQYPFIAQYVTVMAKGVSQSTGMPSAFSNVVIGQRNI